MELLYQVTMDDSIIGPVERNKAHAEGLLHRSGMIFLSRSDGRILIQHRSASKETFPSTYDSSCSFHVTFGETYEEAAKRELFEEVGVSAPLKFLGKFTHNHPPEHEVVAVYACMSDEPVRIDNGEFSNASFCTKDEVDELVASEGAPWFRDGWKLTKNFI